MIWIHSASIFFSSSNTTKKNPQFQHFFYISFLVFYYCYCYCAIWLVNLIEKEKKTKIVSHKLDKFSIGKNWEREIEQLIEIVLPVSNLTGKLFMVTFFSLFFVSPLFCNISFYCVFFPFFPNDVFLWNICVEFKVLISLSLEWVSIWTTFGIERNNSHSRSHTYKRIWLRKLTAIILKIWFPFFSSNKNRKKSGHFQEIPSIPIEMPSDAIWCPHTHT